jgi:predicted RNase H-like HicB family nuclease
VAPSGYVEGVIVKVVTYVVRIDKEPESDWGASVPDLPGCVAVAKTVDGALRRIQVAIEMHLAALRADGVRLPRPRRRMLVGAPRWPSRAIYAWVDVAA